MTPNILDAVKRYRYRAYPTPDQEQSLARLYGCVRVVFNDVIAARNKARTEGAPYPKTAELSLALTRSKSTPGTGMAHRGLLHPAAAGPGRR